MIHGLTDSKRVLIIPSQHRVRASFGNSSIHAIPNVTKTFLSNNKHEPRRTAVREITGQFEQETIHIYSTPPLRLEEDTIHQRRQFAVRSHVTGVERPPRASILQSLPATYHLTHAIIRIIVRPSSSRPIGKIFSVDRPASNVTFKDHSSNSSNQFPLILCTILLPYDRPPQYETTIQTSAGDRYSTTDSMYT